MSPPASSSLWRRVVNDVKIDGISIPKGYDVGTCIYAIHHNAEYYPDSFCYRPERWLDGGDSIQGKSTGTSLAYSAFTPFSIGPRGCVGKTLAMTELMLVMATILSRFEFTAEDAKVGGGLAGAKCGRHREGEYQLYDHVTAAKNGPMIRFTARG
jgi:cytochrome P450